MDGRLKQWEEALGGRAKPQPIEVNVVTHDMQRYAVWFGGAMLANTVRTTTSASHSAYTGSEHATRRVCIVHVCIVLFSSLRSPQPEFYRVCHTRADYEEKGPAIARHNAVFGSSI